MVAEKIKTRILCSITFFENRAVCGTMRRHAAMPDRSQKTIWRTSIACCITKAKNTNSQYIYNTYGFPTAKIVLRTRLNITLYVRCHTFINCNLWHRYGQYF